MQVPLEISYNNVEKTQSIDDLIHQESDHLEKICDYITSCRVAVEKPQEHQQSGNPYRVRIDITLPPGQEIIVDRNLGKDAMHADLDTVVRESFGRAERQLKKLMAKQRDDVKTHPAQEANGVIQKLFLKEGYGFIQTVEGREVYFHQNSVLNSDFNRLEIGTGVHYFEEMGEKGAQAGNVQIVDKPGSRIEDES